MPDTPSSPPAAPVIPVGPGTRLGLAGTALLGLAAALAPLLPHTGAETSRAFATLGTILATATVLGRMLQSAAALLGAPRLASAPQSAHFISHEVVADDPQDQVADDEPGDPDGLPTVDPHPGNVPPDEGDAGQQVHP